MIELNDEPDNPFQSVRKQEIKLQNQKKYNQKFEFLDV